MKIKEKQIREEEREEGREEGREEVKRKTVCKLLEDGMTIEKIARIMEVKVEDIKRWVEVK